MLLRIVVIIITAALFSCEVNDRSSNSTVISKDPVLSGIRPDKPVKVQLKRNYKGEYSWDIKGDDVSKIIEADKELSESLKNKIKED
ncbi:MAG: hypothetical protein JSV21_10145 [Nitrospirota bacterium]|nr:MAG: hypothetical protein JSV21_10145 [Nitrospirota bacterium]